MELYVKLISFNEQTKSALTLEVTTLDFIFQVCQRCCTKANYSHRIYCVPKSILGICWMTIWPIFCHNRNVHASIQTHKRWFVVILIRVRIWNICDCLSIMSAVWHTMIIKGYFIFFISTIWKRTIYWVRMWSKTLELIGFCVFF